VRSNVCETQLHRRQLTRAACIRLTGLTSPSVALGRHIQNRIDSSFDNRELVDKLRPRSTSTVGINMLCQWQGKQGEDWLAQRLPRLLGRNGHNNGTARVRVVRSLSSPCYCEAAGWDEHDIAFSSQDLQTLWPRGEMQTWSVYGEVKQQKIWRHHNLKKGSHPLQSLQRPPGESISRSG